MKRARLRLAGLAALSLFFPSCMSKQPLGDFKRAVVDKQLLGTWVPTEDRGVSYLHIGRLKGNQAPRGFVQILSVEFGDRQELFGTDAVGFSTTIADCRYLNLSPIVQKDQRFDPADAERLGGWLFFKYQIDGNRVEAWAADSSFVKREIAAGKIAGAVNWGGATLTDSSENLAKWVAANDSKIFVEKTTFKRVVVK